MCGNCHTAPGFGCSVQSQRPCTVQRRLRVFHAALKVAPFYMLQHSKGRRFPANQGRETFTGRSTTEQRTPSQKCTC